jgi:hypothetical protein
MTAERAVRYDDASVLSTFAFMLDRSGALARVSTEVPLRSRLNEVPNSGRIKVFAAQGRSLVLSPVYSPSTFPVRQFEIQSSDGRSLQVRTGTWTDDEGALSWDGRSFLDGTRYPIQPLGLPHLFEAPRDAQTNHGLLALFREPGSAASPEIDPLFLHPVLAAPGVSDARATFRVQLNSEPTAGTSLHFRFVDSTRVGSETLPRDPVATTVTQFGALYVLRPVESLSHATLQTLEVSRDGVTWNRDAIVSLQGKDGRAMQLPGALGSVFTPPLLRLELAYDSAVALGPDDAVLLQADVTPAAGAALASVRWEQVSGAPVLLETPEATSTRVRYAAGAPRTLDLVQLKVTVTDTRGRVERARINLKVGNVVTAGAAMYAERRLSSLPDKRFPVVRTGSGAVVPGDSTAGSLVLRVTSPPAVEPERLELAAPDGAALAVGLYANSVLGPAPVAGRSLMGCWVFPCNGQGQGQFEVLELVRDNEGRIVRMAVDFQQRSPDADIVETLRGSYRYNSQVPLRP